MFAYFIGPGRPVEVKDGVKISVTLGHFIVICKIVKLANFYFDFLCQQLHFEMSTLLKYALKTKNYFLHKRFLLSFPQFLLVQAAILHIEKQ